ncbi:MAG: hypothetical protein H6739_11485 [Alphaproteobacteria bacterium]|nr:hypothetical protein [Alphaproteobacteria bacterium]
MVVDAGNLLWKTARLPEADRAQRLIKADLIADAYALSGVDAVVPGDGDLAFGAAAWWEMMQDAHIPVVAANLSCEGLPELPGSRRLEVGGRTLGVIGVVGGTPEGCAVSDATEAVSAELDALGPVDALILLSTLRNEDERALAAKIPEIDFIVNGHDRLTNSDPRALEGGAWQLSSGSRGKKLGVLDLIFEPGASGWQDMGAAASLAKRRDQFRDRLKDAERLVAEATDDAARSRAERRVEFYEREITKLEAELALVTTTDGAPHNRFESRLVELGTEVGEHAATQALVDQAKAAIEQAGSAPQAGAPFASTAFVGSNFCQGCHLSEHQQWASTGHANAWAALQKAQRQMDDDCFSCHVTGAFHPEGPQKPAQVGALVNVGCEACHGPGGQHTKAPTEHPMKAEVSVKTCTLCHDGEQDGGRFDYDAYLPKVLHTAAKPE